MFKTLTLEFNLWYTFVGETESTSNLRDSKSSEKIVVLVAVGFPWLDFDPWDWTRINFSAINPKSEKEDSEILEIYPKTAYLEIKMRFLAEARESKTLGDWERNGDSDYNPNSGAPEHDRGGKYIGN